MLSRNFTYHYTLKFADKWLIQHISDKILTEAFKNTAQASAEKLFDASAQMYTADSVSVWLWVSDMISSTTALS